MIINHSLELIFMKTKKVGGTSFEIALSKFCCDDDIVTPILPADEKRRTQLGFQEPCNYKEAMRERYKGSDHPNAGIKGFFKHHMTSEQVFDRVGGGVIFQLCEGSDTQRSFGFLDFPIFLQAKKRQN